MQPTRLQLGLLFLLLPLALLLNLGLAPFIDDEANRSLVAMEMLWSDNYITPTMHGAYYYNKPPLWNWILTVSFSIWGEMSEWAARFPSVLALLGYGATIYYFCRKHFSWQRSLLAALAFVTCGRVLFWESFLALIDISFSWAMFALFMVVYHEGEKERWGRLFLYSYGLMVIGFMFKGLPAFVFQGITLLTYLIWRGEWKRLFSIAHIGSGLLSVALLALYYWQYHQYNSLKNVFTTLFVESGKRTAVAQGLGKTIEHLLTFPLELLYHFAPWTLLLGLALFKPYRQRWQQQPFIQYCLLVFLTNVIVYWISPNFYPRYVLMLMPLLFIAAIQLLPEEPTKGVKRLQLFLLLPLLVVLFLTASFLAFNYSGIFLHGREMLPYISLKMSVVAILLLASVIYYYSNVEHRWFTLVLAVLIFRVGFNFISPPLKVIDSRGQTLRDDCERLAQRWQENDIQVFHESLMEPAVSFYLQRTTGAIIPRVQQNWQKDQLYLYNPDQYHSALFAQPVDSIKVRHATRGYYFLAQLQITDPKRIEELTLHPPAGF